MNTIQYRNFPEKVKSFIELYFNLQKNSFLKDKFQSFHISFEKRPKNYPHFICAEFIPPTKIAYYKDDLKWEGIIHDTTHFVQYCTNKKEFLKERELVKTAAFTNYNIYRENVYEKEAFKVQEAYKKYTASKLSWLGYDMFDHNPTLKEKMDLAEATDNPIWLSILAKDENNGVRTYVASNSNTPTSTLEKLSKDKDYGVRRYVASNSNTPISTLERLSNDENGSVREGVANNPNTPTSILEKLCNDEVRLVRLYIASNPNTSISILERLSEDEEYEVRYHVAINLNTPTSILEKLSKDEYGSVRNRAKENLRNKNRGSKISRKILDPSSTKNITKRYWKRSSKNPYKDLLFNYDPNRGQQITEYEPAEGDSSALNPLDMQQVYDTDFFEPFIDKKDKEIKSLDWQDRSNLQFGV